MKIEDYIKSLPEDIISGEAVQLPDVSFREIFRFANLGIDDTFYHLGCGNGRGIKIAIEEFNVKKAVGIDNDKNRIRDAQELLQENNNANLVCQDVTECEGMSEASVILFWFTDEKVVEKMTSRFASLKKGCRVITIWSPLPDCLPDKIDFPYIMSKVPFRKAESIQDQLLAVFGVKCIDFITAWEFAERYTKAISFPDSENDRFLTIIQSLVIWINAKNLGIACGKEIPESIRTYIGILKRFFNIDVEHLIKEDKKQ